MHFFKEGPTKVIGHRGSPRKALENTIESFDLAEADGADGFELDVRLTSDGEAVVLHDAEALLGDRRVPIASLTMPDIEGSSIRNATFQGQIPTLRDVFFRYRGQGRYLVELKSGPSPKTGLLEFRVAALLVQLNLLERALVISFSPDMLRRIMEIEPRIQTGLTFDGTAYRPEGKLWPDLPTGCKAIGPNVALVSEKLFADAKAADIGVHVWTVNEPELAGHLATLGAASVITDVPDVVGPAVRAVTGALSPMNLFETRSA